MRWFKGSISEAIAEAKSKNAIFIVYISGEDEQSAKMNTTFESTEVSNTLDKAGCIAVKLQSNSDTCRQFSQISSTFFIGENGVPLEIIGGDLPPKDFLVKIDNVFKITPTLANLESACSSSIRNSNSSTCADETPGETLEHKSLSVSQSSASNTVEDRAEKMKHLIVERREQKAKQQAEEEKRKEQERRKHGQDVQKLRQWQQNVETKQLADDIAKEKAEERAARERVREQIARDRAERAARFQTEKKEAEQRQQEAQAAALQAQQAKLSAETLARSNNARLQFRFPDGSFDTQQFSADDTLEQVRQYVLQVSRSPLRAFTLCTTFPRREFQELDYSQTLRDLQLAPCAAILVLPIQQSLVTSSSTGMYNFIWTAFGSILAFFSHIRAFLFGSRINSGNSGTSGQSSPQTQKQSPGNPSVSSGVPDSAQSSNRPIAADKRRNPDDSGSVFSRKEGNIHRISNRKDDDDENSTWNGNSTQQM